MTKESEQIKIPPGDFDEYNQFEEDPGVCGASSRL